MKWKSGYFWNFCFQRILDFIDSPLLKIEVIMTNTILGQPKLVPDTYIVQK